MPASPGSLCSQEERGRGPTQIDRGALRIHSGLPRSMSRRRRGALRSVNTCWTSAHMCTCTYAHVPSTCVYKHVTHAYTYMCAQACMDVHTCTYACMHTHSTHSTQHLGPPPQKKKPVYVSNYNCISESISVTFPQTQDMLRGKHT